MSNIDWNQFNNDLGTSITNAGSQTDAQLAGQIASVTRLTAAEIQSMFPDPADVQKLGQLIQIVQQSTVTNNRVLALEQNITTLSGVVVTLLKKLA